MTEQPYYDVFGRAAKDGATDTCSKCGGTIPEEHVPLMLWNQEGSLMWVYCLKCEKPFLEMVTRK